MKNTKKSAQKVPEVLLDDPFPLAKPAKKPTQPANAIVLGGLSETNRLLNGHASMLRTILCLKGVTHDLDAPEEELLTALDGHLVRLGGA